jgi:hypothetical protein
VGAGLRGIVEHLRPGKLSHPALPAPTLLFLPAE